MHSNWVTQIINAAHCNNSFQNPAVSYCCRLWTCPSLGLVHLPHARATASSWRDACVSSSIADSFKPIFCCRCCTTLKTWDSGVLKIFQPLHHLYFPVYFSLVRLRFSPLLTVQLEHRCRDPFRFSLPPVSAKLQDRSGLLQPVRVFSSVL